jgi:hypothetical protein
MLLPSTVATSFSNIYLTTTINIQAAEKMRGALHNSDGPEGYGAGSGQGDPG